jgi:hypothetical protein
MDGFPAIPGGHYLVYAAEAKTGMLLNLMGEYPQGREDEGYLYWVFDAFEKAEEFALYHVSKKPEHELAIMDSKKKIIKVIRK